MPDFPRGWTLSSAPAPPAAASITIPALPGIVHVLDGFTAKLFNSNTSFGANNHVLLSSSDGAFSSFVLALLATAQPAAATSYQLDSASESGLGLAAGPGASLTISFDGGAASFYEFLLVHGYDD